MSSAQVDGYLRVYFPDGAWSTVPVKAAMAAWQVCEIIARKRNLVKNVESSANPVSSVDSSVASRSVSMLHVPLAPSPGLEQFGLFVQSATAEAILERRVQADEKPLALQESVRKQGQMDKFRFYFKRVEIPVKEGENEENQGISTKFPEIPAGASVSFNDQQSGLDSASSPSPLISSPIDEAAELNRRLQKSKKAFNAHHCGYLEKRGRTNTAWQTRWFILQYEKLYYFKSHLDTTPINFIPIGESTIKHLFYPRISSSSSSYIENSLGIVGGNSNGTMMINSNGNNTGNGNSGNNGHPGHSSSSSSSSSSSGPFPPQRSPYDRFLIEINTTQRIFYLRAHSDSDMEEWIKSLKRATKIESNNELLDEIQAEIDDQAIQHSQQEENRENQLNPSHSQNPLLLQQQPKNLSLFLYDRLGCLWFLSYLQENHCEENLLYWMDAEEYHLLFPQRSHQENKQRALEIVHQYIEENAPHELLIPPTDRKNIPLAIENQLNSMIFHHLQQSVFTYMESGLYMNFLRTRGFYRCLIGIEPKRFQMNSGGGGGGPAAPQALPLFIKYLQDQKIKTQKAAEARAAAAEENELQAGDNEESVKSGDFHQLVITDVDEEEFAAGRGRGETARPSGNPQAANSMISSSSAAVNPLASPVLSAANFGSSVSTLLLSQAAAPGLSPFAINEKETGLGAALPPGLLTSGPSSSSGEAALASGGGALTNSALTTSAAIAAAALRNQQAQAK